MLPLGHRGPCFKTVGVTYAMQKCEIKYISVSYRATALKLLDDTVHEKQQKILFDKDIVTLNVKPFCHSDHCQKCR